MEYNSLVLFIKLLENELNDFLSKFIDFLRMRNVADENTIQKIELFKNRKFHELGGVGECCRTGFFYSNNIEYEIEILFDSEYYPTHSTEERRWIYVDFSIRTSDLAKDKNNDDYLVSNYEYSKKSKFNIKKFARELHNNFASSYIFFVSEYQNVSIDKLEQGMGNNKVGDVEFEYAILPKGKFSEAIKKNRYEIVNNAESIEFCRVDVFK